MLILTVMLGPLGMMYGSVLGGLFFLVIAIVSFPTVIGPIIVWVLSIIFGLAMVYDHNNKQQNKPPSDNAIFFLMALTV